MIASYFFKSLSLAFGSWILGMILNQQLVKAKWYNRLTNLNFIRSKKLNRTIGLPAFKWIVKNTFFKVFNPKLKINVNAPLADLHELHKEMTHSELSHLIAFLLVFLFALIQCLNGNYLFGGVITFVNILMNLYPALLQQENKRRIDRLLAIGAKSHTELLRLNK